MNDKPYREFHILQLLEEYDAQNLPLDSYARAYFKTHKALGPKDRAYVAEMIYGMVRWQGLLDYLCGTPTNWERRLECYLNFNPKDYREQENIPEHVRLSFPKILHQLMIDSLGEDLAKKYCLASNEPAPTTIRINPLKTTRDELFAKWKDTYDISACKQSPLGITFHKRINFIALDEFRLGMFDIQDEGSQLLANLMDVKPGEHVMDYCSGSGGKTLAFAHKMNNQGQIYLHDIRDWILVEAKKRLRRAGIQNAQMIEYNDPKLSKLKKKMDWILVDAPCTGSGTMRRNPDMKWNFTEETLPKYVGQQRTIFEKALSYLSPNGKIVYATCSLFKQENQNQIEHFLKTYNLVLCGEPFQSLPEKGGMDGFFGAVMKKAPKG